MPTDYAGNAASYPANIPLPNDGEPAAAPFLNPAWQRLADRTAYLSAALATESAARAAADSSEATTRAAADVALRNFVRRIPVQSFPHRGTYSTGLGKAVWNPIRQRWFAVGGPDAAANIIVHSCDQGGGWTAETLAASAVRWVDIDVDPTTGNMVAASNSTSLAVYDAATYTWSLVTLTQAASGVRFDPIRNMWCAVGYGGGAHHAWTAPAASPTGAWTDNGPTGLGGTNAPRVEVNKTTGRLVAWNAPLSTEISLATSDDGGVTWTARTSITSGLSSVSNVSVSIAFSSSESRALMSIAFGSQSTMYLESLDDGATWSVKATHATTGQARIGSLACFELGSGYGACWLSVTYQSTISSGVKPHLRVSYDGGATWLYLNRSPTPALSGSSAQGTPCIAVSPNNVMITMTNNSVGTSLASLSIGEAGAAL